MGAKEHSPYSTNISYCHFHVFGQMKEDLVKERFENDYKGKTAVR